MNILGVIMLIAFAGTGLARAAAAPEPIAVNDVPVPADDCFGRTYTCQAKLAFTLGTDGRVSDINVLQSSRSYPCDRALIHSVRSRVYRKQATEVRMEEQSLGYQCTNGRPASSSFKATPIRGK